MSIKSQTLTFYDFDAIEEFICKELGIKQKHFRDYHKVIGGKYKDLWHVWISLNYDNVSNDTYRTVWLDMLIDAIDRCKVEYGDWIECLRPVLTKLQNEVNEDNIIVYYSW